MLTQRAKQGKDLLAPIHKVFHKEFKLAKSQTVVKCESFTHLIAKIPGASVGTVASWKHAAVFSKILAHVGLFRPVVENGISPPHCFKDNKVFEVRETVTIHTAWVQTKPAKWFCICSKILIKGLIGLL